MHCPQCGTRNELGSQACAQCRYPFTRSAARVTLAPAKTSSARRTRPQPATPYTTPTQSVQMPAPSAPPPAPMAASAPQRTAQPAARSRRATPARQRRRRVPRIFYVLIIGVAILIVMLLLGLLAREQLVKPYVADQVRSELDSSIQSAVQQSVAEQPQLPVNEPIVVTEAEINERVAGYDMGPVDDLAISLTPGGVEVDLSAYGLSGRYRAGVQVEGGRLALVDGSLSGPLSLVVPTGEVEQIAGDALATALRDAGYNIAALELGEGTLALTLAQ
jgi:hypothetical protein